MSDTLTVKEKIIHGGIIVADDGSFILAAGRETWAKNLAGQWVHSLCRADGEWTSEVETRQSMLDKLVCDSATIKPKGQWPAPGDRAGLGGLDPDALQ